MTRARLTLICLALTALRCGGGGGSRPTPTTPTTPTPTPPAVFSVRDGETDQPVSAQATPPSPPVGTAVVVRAPGYFDREQRFTGPPVYLWPASDVEYFNQLVYDWEFQDGTRRLVRWASSGFTMTLDGDLAEDSAIVAKAREVAAELSRTSGLTVSVGPGGTCLIGIDPDVADEDAVAIADLDFRGATVIGGKVSFVNRREITGGARADYGNTLLHEMGHILGLVHSPNTRDVMTPGAGPGTRVANFQPGEVLSLHMMYRRRTPGNIYPDRDAELGVAALSSALRHVRIID